MSCVSELIVVDASVVLKWQLDDEECIEQAVMLRNDFYLEGAFQIIAPQLLAYELANGITVAARRKRIAFDKATEALSNLLILGIELRESEPLLSLKLALEYNISAYDAAYLALAMTEKCKLWTGDKALYQAINDQTLVKWIGDYATG
jgi:predicted nucleic acid-binding protein